MTKIFLSRKAQEKISSPVKNTLFASLCTYCSPIILKAWELIRDIASHVPAKFETNYFAKMAAHSSEEDQAEQATFV